MTDCTRQPDSPKGGPSHSPEQTKHSHSGASSRSSSLSLVQVDEVSPFGATKHQRLPALIKLQASGPANMNSMPGFEASQLEGPAKGLAGSGQSSLPAKLAQLQSQPADELLAQKENCGADSSMGAGDFHMVDERELEAATAAAAAAAAVAPAPGPSLAAPLGALATSQAVNQFGQLSQQQPSQLGDSLIDMIINLRNENQNLVRALDTNNEYVRQRLDEFKRLQEQAQRREAELASEKAELEHQVRKLARQNSVLSERLKSMEGKLRDMRLEAHESLQAAASSRASSGRGPSEQQQHQQLDEGSSGSSGASSSSLEDSDGDVDLQQNPDGARLYPQLGTGDSLAAPPATMALQRRPEPPSAPPATDSMAGKTAPAAAAQQATQAQQAPKSIPDCYNLLQAEQQDPMRECDKLEKQLNELGKRDYEICLLQQQLNIYRQDYRLERMANLEAQLQIERLKADINKLCFERLQRDGRERQNALHDHSQAEQAGSGAGYIRRLADSGLPQAAGQAALKLGHQLGRRAAKSAAKHAARAAKHASKQAHREERAAASAAAAAYSASVPSGAHPEATSTQAGGPPSAPPAQDAYAGQRHGRRHHQHQAHQRPLNGLRAVKSEVVNDLLSTANKAMLTGYKMASTHVNLALDKLSEFERSQASHLSKGGATGKAANGSSGAGEHSDAPSID